MDLCDLHTTTRAALFWIQTSFIPGVFVFVLVIGLFLNLLSLWVFFTCIKSWTRSTFFLCNLALADVTWLLNLPFLIQYHLGQLFWPFGEWLCKINRTLYHTCFYCSIYFITCVSVDRYLAIAHPINSFSLLTKRQSVMVCLAVWTINFVFSVPIAQMAVIQTCPDNKTICSLYVFFSSTKETLPFSLTCTVTGCLCPFFAICYCYSTSMQRLQKQCHQPWHLQRMAKLSKVMYSALFIFAVLYLPYHLIRNVAIGLHAAHPTAIGPPLYADSAFAVEMAICSLNTCINPFFYFLTGGDFRQHFCGMFSCPRLKSKLKKRRMQKTIRLHVATICPA
ncbi:succinate receptor 1-like [Polypterus senegalus]|uniref:succinate receptor 1-like n=1 Tax=Polypterus senegalus TaxID=55291 RepID=UPI001966029E|nr:succinate receptor 1-like [Polypterus senegalus]